MIFGITIQSLYKYLGPGRILLLSLLMLCTLGAAAVETAGDSIFMFRFPKGKPTFLVPYQGNGATLRDIVARLDSCRSPLSDGHAYISVTGYVAAETDRNAAMRLGYLRNSHVKSELIVRAKVKERMFVTDRVIIGDAPGGQSDVVIVTFPASVEKVASIAGEEAAAKVKDFQRAAAAESGRDIIGEQQAVTPTPKRDSTASGHHELRWEKTTAIPGPLSRKMAAEKSKHDKAAQTTATTSATTPASERDPRFAVRANLLRWATLTPDLGLEWSVTSRWSLLVNGSWTSWSWNDKARRYALWEIMPELRYYIGSVKRGYVGAMFKTGSFNYKFSGTGRQGDITGGGITGGYVLRLNGSLALDFSVAAGYLKADFKKYTVENGVRIRRGSSTHDWWGPINTGVTLVWNLF